MKKLIYLALCIILFGCSHNSAFNELYTRFDHDQTINKPVSYAIVNIDAFKINGTQNQSGCWFHYYQVDGSPGLGASLASMLESTFQGKPRLLTLPEQDTPHIVFKVEKFEHQLIFSDVSVNTSIDLSVSVVVSFNHKIIMQSVVNSSRTNSEYTGGSCSTGASVLADTMKEVVRDIVNQAHAVILNNHDISSL